jgi:DNA-binding response OmpR family regulator
MPGEIFLVEDDQSLGSLMEAVFNGNGSQVTWSENGNEALNRFQPGKFSICVIDLSLPDTNGIELGKQLRLTDPGIPFLILTANQEAQVKYNAFEAGCDDFILKPFQMRELILRVEAILRRTSHQPKKQVDFPDFSFNYNTRQISFNKKEVKLSTKEASLFRLLYENHNNTLNRSYLMQNIWGNTDLYTSKNLDVYLSKLRKILDENSHFEILNEHGIGYKLITKAN